MNKPGFTAEAAIYNRPASFQMPPAGANRTPAGAVAMAFTCPEECPCVCGQGPYGRGQVIRDQAP